MRLLPYGECCKNGYGLGSILPSPKIKDRLSFQLFLELFLLNEGTAKSLLSLRHHLALQ